MGGQSVDLEVQDMATVAQDMVLHMAKVHLQLLVMAHLKLLAMVNPKLLVMVNPKLLVMVNSKLLLMAHLKLLSMVNNRDRCNLVSNSSNNPLSRVSSNLQHNSLQPLSDSTGMPDELCWKKCIVPGS